MSPAKKGRWPLLDTKLAGLTSRESETLSKDQRGGGKRWITSAAESCEDCIENESQGLIDVYDAFSSGDAWPAAHVNCSCYTTVSKMKVEGSYGAGGVNWQSPSGPGTTDYYETYMGLGILNHEHPPSLKNPIKTVIPTAQDGFHKGDSKDSKKRAMEDLIELHKRMRRQIPKPEITHTANYPIFPDITRNF